MPLVANIYDKVIDDLAGDDFALGEKWEIQGVDDYDICIKEGLHNIGGTQIRDPTFRPSEFVKGEYGEIKKITN